MNEGNRRSKGRALRIKYKEQAHGVEERTFGSGADYGTASVPRRPSVTYLVVGSTRGPARTKGTVVPSRPVELKVRDLQRRKGWVDNQTSRKMSSGLGEDHDLVPCLFYDFTSFTILFPTLTRSDFKAQVTYGL